MDQFDFFIIFSPAWLLVSFLLYWPLFFRLAEEGKASKIIAVRIYGAVLFGAVPVIVSLIFGFSLSDKLGFQINFRDSREYWLISLSIALLLPLINFFTSKSRSNLEEFPQIRNAEWTKTIFAGNIFSWIIYLIGYEILFRGIMLFPLVDNLGLWPVIVIGTVLYSFSHFPKSMREALGAIPFGIILALLAWRTQSVWPCILIHTSLALSNSLWSLKHHPNISLISNKN